MPDKLQNPEFDPESKKSHSQNAVNTLVFESDHCFGSRGSGVRVAPPRPISNVNSTQYVTPPQGGALHGVPCRPLEYARVDGQIRDLSGSLKSTDRIEKVCENCGVLHGAQVKELRRGKGRYCSLSCSSTAFGKTRTGKLNPNWKGGVAKDNMRYKLRFEKKSPEKVVAHRITLAAIKSGELVRRPCERCGFSDLKKIHAHHEDYSKPLKVIWFCHPCHNRHHARVRAK